MINGVRGGSNYAERNGLQLGAAWEYSMWIANYSDDFTPGPRAVIHSQLAVQRFPPVKYLEGTRHTNDSTFREEAVLGSCRVWSLRSPIKTVHPLCISNGDSSATVGCLSRAREAQKAEGFLMLSITIVIGSETDHRIVECGSRSSDLRKCQTHRENEERTPRVICHPNRDGAKSLKCRQRS